jgi:pyruvate kinase
MSKNIKTKIIVEKKSKELSTIAEELKLIKEKLKKFRKTNASLITRLHPQFKESGLNFLYYLALRQIDLKDLQLHLARFGLSSLGRCESYVMSNIQQVLARINDTLIIQGKITFTKTIKAKKVNSTETKIKPLTWSDAEKILHLHTQDLFGPKPKRRHVYIMATVPSMPQFSEDWVENILKAGANLLRINCAHDCKEDWEKMIACIRLTSEKLNIPCKIHMDLGGPKIRTGSPAYQKLSVGDTFSLVSKIEHKKKEILCTLPQVFKFVKVGERVLFDDGKIESKIISKSGTKKIQLEVIRVPAPLTKLKSEKGINFPDSHIKISEITEQDLIDLKFVGIHADLIGLSFIQTPEAILKIRKELKKITKKAPGLILKIETKAGFAALPKLLLEAMKSYPCGVMIARGDLGVEVGFERMVEIQEEILWLCEAAHVPVIWATQVLENLAKTGLASRAEVTDAASAVRAECVMLNKGPYIVSAVKTLDNILERMEFHTYKKRNLYRKLKVAVAF